MILLGMPGWSQLLLILIFLVGLLLPILALISILRNEFTGSNKIIWVIVVILVPYLGAILYLLIGRSQRLKK
ncbi:MAG: PLDc N-terminal domain-containing protein [Bacteroidales bacterium]|nr:PLDc N-terminal domain-containing protein [Bacteroidales bacterium]